MYTQEIICPSCGKMTIVNVLSTKGDTRTPCMHCAKSITVATDKNGKVEQLNACFIATAVYGNPNSESVITLRDFRDQHLLKYKVGRSFINFYYENSPYWAKKIEKNETSKMIIRVFVITPIVLIINIYNSIGK